MPIHHDNIDDLLALCILKPGERCDSILAYFRARGLEYVLFRKMPSQKSRFWGLGGDLILIDTETEGVDLTRFFSQCRSVYNAVPVVVFHDGPRGAREAELIRMGAFDALPRHMDQRDTQIYLDRAITQAVQVRKLLSLAWTDHLTGLFNRRFLFENLESEIRRKSRTGKDLTVALIDLDNFHAFNDTYGYLKGDDVLAEIAHIIQSSIRKGIDSAYRYGGDEFLFLLPETDLRQAEGTLERILYKVTGRISEKLTFSIGLALLGACDQGPDVVRCAEEAMLKAREKGGDAVIKAVCTEKDQKWLDGTKVI